MSGWISSKLKVAETLLQQIDQQAAESLRKNEASSRSDNDDDLNLSAAAAPVPKKPPVDIIKDQLKKKKPDKTEFVANFKVADNDLNPKSSNSSLTDTDWTELLSAPSPSKGNISINPRGKRQARSGSNLSALDTKRTQPSASRRSTDNVLAGGDKSKAVVTTVAANNVIDNGTKSQLSPAPVSTNINSDNSLDVSDLNDEILPEKQSSAAQNVHVKNEKIAAVPVISVSRKMSASDVDLNIETDSDTSSDSESETEREERRKRREQLLAEKAAAKAIETIKNLENLVARLEGEKQSLEKTIDDRSKQQAREASELQMTMMETMEAVDIEKQKHNNTRMEALMKLAKLETTNSELAKSLATAQWNLEVEVKRVAELHRQIELKEANNEELTSKKRNQISGNTPTTLREVEFEYEVLEAELSFVADKIGQLQQKARTIETNLQVTRKEMENPTEVEVELKRRLGQLTDHLIQKQSQVEALSSEKAMLMFRIEAVTRSLDENKSYLNTLTNNELESGGIWEVSNSKFQDKLQKGQKHIGSLVRQLDSIFLTGATFLRRNPTGRIWSFVYIVCLHLWVLYIFRSHTAVSYEAGSGAVISLENISTTSSV
ncbi:golgin candidate 2 [Rutidosis leptorrhynchoides]|uniref:golgin candidate 2 n=1 Tax=Rutidosis leptorrhynchoides TaxID=125765 RepID=UPI003A99C6BE